MTTEERFAKLFQELWDINPVITILMILVPVYFIGKFIVELFVGSLDGSGSEVLSDEPPSPEAIEEEKRRQQAQEDRDTAIFLAYEAYRLEQWKSHATCSHCLRKTLAQDEDGNDCYNCSIYGLLPQYESDQPHYCEYYHGFGEP